MRSGLSLARHARLAPATGGAASVGEPFGRLTGELERPVEDIRDGTAHVRKLVDRIVGA